MILFHLKGCYGGNVDEAFEYIEKQGGLNTEKSYPYKGRDGRCHFKKENVEADVRKFVDIERGDENALKHAVATKVEIE